MKLVSLLLFWPIWSTLAAQTNQNLPSPPSPLPVPDYRLFQAFDSTYIYKVQNSNPTLLKRWNFYLDNAFVITDFPAQKGDSSKFQTVEIQNLTSFNIFVLEKEQRLTHDWETPVFYKIKGTDKVLMFLPGKLFAERFKTFLENFTH